MKEIESEAWEDFLDITISQSLLWAGMNIAPEEKSSAYSLLLSPRVVPQLPS